MDLNQKSNVADNPAPVEAPKQEVRKYDPEYRAYDTAPRMILQVKKYFIWKRDGHKAQKKVITKLTTQTNACLKANYIVAAYVARSKKPLMS